MFLVQISTADRTHHAQTHANRTRHTTSSSTQPHGTRKTATQERTPDKPHAHTHTPPERRTNMPKINNRRRHRAPHHSHTHSQLLTQPPPRASALASGLHNSQLRRMDHDSAVTQPSKTITNLAHLTIPNKQHHTRDTTLHTEPHIFETYCTTQKRKSVGAPPPTRPGRSLFLQASPINGRC